jgi:enamine deaminase RidA (YjgF/YER057c/UK114 family)
LPLERIQPEGLYRLPLFTHVGRPDRWRWRRSANFSNVARITIYATDASYRPAIAAVRREYVGSPDPLASTFVAVAGLALPELLVEIDGVAVLD